MVVDCHIHMALDGGYWKDALAPDDVEFVKMGSETFTNQRFDQLVKGDAYETAATAGTRANGQASWRKSTASATARRFFRFTARDTTEASSDAALRRLMTSARLFPR